MYIHSVKVPRLYKDAAKVLKEAKENNGSVKKLIYQIRHCLITVEVYALFILAIFFGIGANINHILSRPVNLTNKKAISALVNETLRRFYVIDSLIEQIGLLTQENRFDPWLARILITELLWGKKQLPDQSLPLKTLLTYREKLEEYQSQLDPNINEKVKTKVQKPRVVRVNTLITSVENAVHELKYEDWILVPFTGESYEDFVTQCASLNENEFMQDLHYKELLQFPFFTEFHKSKAYKNGSLVLQDKASCIPAHLLNPQPGSTVLDMCAAPGMKTSHLAALLNNNGKIYAVERDYSRYETLNEFVNKLGATCVETIQKDVLRITAEDCPNVEYILVDPTCSGSGMTDRNDYNNDPPTEERLEKLAGFQILILKHALLRFPQAKRVVYSTCSIYPRENEYVIQAVLENDIDFRLVNAQELVKGSWETTKEWKDISENCLCMKPDKDLTNGFFIAVFERYRETVSKKIESQTNKIEKQGKIKKNKNKQNYEDCAETASKPIPEENVGDVEEDNYNKLTTSIDDIGDVSTDQVISKKQKNTNKVKKIKRPVDEVETMANEDEPEVVSKKHKKPNKNKRNYEDCAETASKPIQEENVGDVEEDNYNKLTTSIDDIEDVSTDQVISKKQKNKNKVKKIKRPVDKVETMANKNEPEVVSKKHKKPNKNKRNYEDCAETASKPIQEENVGDVEEDNYNKLTTSIDDIGDVSTDQVISKKQKNKNKVKKIKRPVDEVETMANEDEPEVVSKKHKKPKIPIEDQGTNKIKKHKKEKRDK